MTVAELIAELQQMPQDAEVMVDTDDAEDEAISRVFEHSGLVVIDCTGAGA